MKKIKANEEFLMSNIQVVYMQKKLLKEADFSTLLSLTDWEAIRQFLNKYDYHLEEDISIEAVDRLFQQNIEKLEKIIYELNVPEDYLRVLFVKRDTFKTSQLNPSENIDEKILQVYGKFAENGLHPIVRDYAKYCIDEFYLSDYFRNINQQITLKEHALGFLSKKELTQLEGLPIKDGVHWLKQTRYRELFSDDFVSVSFEKRFDNWLIDKYREYRYQTIGLEGIFAFVFEKIMEMFNLRLVLKSKIYHIKEEDVRERMRHSYG